MEKVMTVTEIENELSNIYKSRKKWEESGWQYDGPLHEDRYDMEMDALYDSEQYYIDKLRDTYPNAFDSEYGDTECYEALATIYEQWDRISPEDILNATKLDDTDVIYVCKVRSMYNGKFVNNYVHIYMDNDYTGREDIMIQDYEMACSAICYALGHEFVAVLACSKV